MVVDALHQVGAAQVIIDRWEAFTGQKAVKAGEAVRA